MKSLINGSAWNVAPLLFFAAFSANATTVEYSIDIFGPSGSQMPVSAITLTLPKFNTSLGTLTKVELFVYWTDTSSIVVANTDDLLAHSFSGATASVPLTLSGSGFSDLQIIASTNPISSATSTPTLTTAAGGPVFGMDVPKAVRFVGLPCPPGQVCSFSGINAYTNVTGSGQSSTVISPSNLGLFAGNGNFITSLVGGIPTFGVPGGSTFLMFGGDMLLKGTFKVEYTFSPATEVPEPVTMLLVGPAVVGLALKLRRRSRRVV